MKKIMLLGNSLPARFIVMLLCSFIGFADAIAQTNCMPVKPRPSGGAAIGKGGKYCLLADMLVDSRYNPFAHGAEIRGTDSTLLVLGANDITLDLMQHTIEGNAPLHGGIETPIAGKPEYKKLPEFSHADRVLKPRNLFIKNGNLVLTERASGAPGIRLADSELFFSIASDLTGMWQAQTGKPPSAQQIELAQKWTKEMQDHLPRSAADYEQRGIVIEDMNIKSNDVGILIEGAGTVIRHSRIEVNAGTGIWIFGPNARIEDNTIVVHRKFKPLDGDAPIRFHHGTGAIIRNNKIVLAGEMQKRIVFAVDTEELTIENNTFSGLSDKDELVTAVGVKPKILSKFNKYEISLRR